MTLAELKQLLGKTGYPVAYSNFKVDTNNPAPIPPYICYLFDSSSNFMADNKVYLKISNFRVELYTNKKDLSAEKTLEDLFDQNNIPWDADEIWIESEKLYQRIYEIGVN